jgi:hypothetical protein
MDEGHGPSIIESWPEESREAAQLVIDKYGEPHEATDSGSRGCREEALEHLWVRRTSWIKLKNPNYWRRDAEIEAMQRSAERRARVRSHS